MSKATDVPSSSKSVPVSETSDMRSFEAAVAAQKVDPRGHLATLHRDYLDLPENATERATFGRFRTVRNSEGMAKMRLDWAEKNYRKNAMVTNTGELING